MSSIGVRDEVPRSSEDIGSLLEWLVPERAVADRARQPFLRIAHLSVRFWAGDQYADLVDGASARWELRRPRPEGTYGVRKVDNQLLKHCRHALANCAQAMPQMEVDPATTDEDDTVTAAYGTGVLRWAHRCIAETWIREMELMNLVGMAESLRRQSWDPDGGNPANPQGDILAEVLTPFGYMKDPHSIGRRWPPRYIIEEDARHVDWIQQRYGKKVEPQEVAEALQYQDKLATAVMTGASAGPRQPMEGAALVTRLTVPESRKHPQGRTWVFSGRGKEAVLLEEHRLQTDSDGRAIFPYSLATWYPIPLRHHAMSLVEMVMSKQMELNHLVSLLYEAAIQGVRGDVITSGMNTDAHWEEYDERTGAQMLKLGPAVDKWERVSLTADFGQAEHRRQVLEGGMREDVGTSQADLAQTSSGDTTAFEVGVMKEASQQGIQWHLSRYSTYHLAPTSLQTLKLLQKNVVIPRVIQVPGGEGVDPEVMVFSGADLAGCDDVVPVAKPYMSPAMEQQATFQAWQMALGGEFETLEQVWKFRQMLIGMGLDKVEAHMARVWGPIEELERAVQQMAGLKVQAEAARLQAEIGAAAAVGQQAQQAAEGQPEEAADVGA